MSSQYLWPVLALACLVSVIEARRGRHSSDVDPPSGKFQLQNPATGRCAVIENNSDGWWAKVVTHKCSCSNDYHYWVSKGETLVSQGRSKQCLANWEKLGHPGVTQCICVNDAIHKWNFEDLGGGNFQMVSQVDSRCAYAGDSDNSQLRFDDCDKSDQEQAWRFFDACHPPAEPGAPPPPPPVKPPSGNFQLMNPETGRCAVIENNSDGWWAKVITHKCSCNNDYHYWKLNGKTLISQGKSKQCLANWEKLGHPGVTQCICVNDAIHTWNFEPLQDGSFQLVSGVDSRCAYAGGQDAQLRFDDCDQNDKSQSWTFYDSCHPPAPPPPPPPPAPAQATNVIPTYLTYFFENGNMNWLNPTRYTLLVGGRWDSTTSTWYTIDGRQIQPNTELWTIYFGDAKPSFLNVLFPPGKTWTDIFSWMSPTFFQTWTTWRTTTAPPQPQPNWIPSGFPPPSQPRNAIPSNLVTYFTSGQMNFLTPQRYIMLVGGRWDPSTNTWYTMDGGQVVPNTVTWTQYFGNAQPSLLNILFPGGKTWNDTFSWMSPDFFQTWTSWNSGSPPSPPPQPQNAIPSYMTTFFSNGQMNFLTPQRYSLLNGGRWDSSTTTWYTADGRPITPNSPMWTIYFGDTKPSFLNLLFSNGRSTWNDAFGWMTINFFQTWRPAPPPKVIYDPPHVVYVYDPPTVKYENVPENPTVAF